MGSKKHIKKSGCETRSKEVIWKLWRMYEDKTKINVALGFCCALDTAKFVAFF
jgi:hypothetical protein